MFETLYSISNGVGLAGNQIGESKSILVLDLSVDEDNKNSKPMTMINPVIEYYSEEEFTDSEGCLSIPTYYEQVTRSYEIQLKYTDLDMKEHVIEAEDFFSRVLQHEIDHLNGKLIIEKISPLRRALSKSKLKKIERGILIPDYPMILPDGSTIGGDS